MANLEDVIRLASERPLKDAAFFASFNIKLGKIVGDTRQILRLAHPRADENQIEDAMRASSLLEGYCASISRKKANALRDALNLAKSKFPGFSDETYQLVPRYSNLDEIKKEFADSAEANDRLWLKLPAYLLLTLAVARLVRSLLLDYFSN